MTKRVIAFVDGFNLYHSMDNNTALHRYKWLNLHELISQFLPSTETLQETRYFTAYATWNPQKVGRHKHYVTLLERFGVRAIFGQFIEKDKTSLVPCTNPCQQGNKPNICGKTYKTHEEKLTDVNIAVDMLRVCIRNECESIYLISGDNDLVPSLKAIQELFPSIGICVLLPINSKAKRLMSICKQCGFRYARIKEEHLKKARFSDLTEVDGQTFSCPPNWR